jgi:hypothetical protein
VKGFLAGAKGQWLAAAAAVSVGVAGVGLIGLAVTPGAALALRGSSATPDSFEDLSENERAVARGLRDLMQSCAGVLHAGVDDRGRTAVSLLQSAPGAEEDFSLAHALVLLHVPILRTIEALSFPDDGIEGGDAEPASVFWSETEALFDASLMAGLRGRPGATRSVVATNVRTLEVRRSGGAGGEQVLHVTLTWAGSPPDGPHSATFEVRLPAAHP